MLSNIMAKWYTDSVTIKRAESYKEGNLTKHKRVIIAENVPCRIYTSKKAISKMKETDAEVSKNDMLAVDIGVDIKAGDELFVTRGGVLGYDTPAERYFAGKPNIYFEPFAGVMPNISHQEIPLSGESRN